MNASHVKLSPSSFARRRKRKDIGEICHINNIRENISTHMQTLAQEQLLEQDREE